MKKKLLILSGPQGSGNHVWSKIFALHPEVQGWGALLNQYWVGHDQEPFSDCWRDPVVLRQRDWSLSDYFVTSISVPYMENGVPSVPDIQSFCSEADALGLRVILACLGRDRNILTMQEQRLRGSETYHRALEVYETLRPNIYLSYELLQLYKGKYLKSISDQIGFPILWESEKINEILVEDTNKKYFQPIEYHWVDDLARATSRKWK